MHGPPAVVRRAAGPVGPLGRARSLDAAVRSHVVEGAFRDSVGTPRIEVCEPIRPTRRERRRETPTHRAALDVPSRRLRVVGGSIHTRWSAAGVPRSTRSERARESGRALDERPARRRPRPRRPPETAQNPRAADAITHKPFAACAHLEGSIPDSRSVARSERSSRKRRCATRSVARRSGAARSIARARRSGAASVHRERAGRSSEPPRRPPRVGHDVPPPPVASLERARAAASGCGAFERRRPEVRRVGSDAE